LTAARRSAAAPTRRLNASNRLGSMPGSSSLLRGW
jgi:hypothetical protein